MERSGEEMMWMGQFLCENVLVKITLVSKEQISVQLMISIGAVGLDQLILVY